MILDRRQATRLLLAGGAAAATPLTFSQMARAKETLERLHGDSLVGDLKYPADFARFDYANPDAPKGGEVRLHMIGAFNSFNGFIVKGDPATSLGLIYDSLMSRSLDESSTQYGLLAEWMEHPADYSYVDFKLRENATWHDGVPVTPRDAVFGFNLLVEKGFPGYKFYYGNVEKAEDMGGNIVRFTFDEKNNRELPHIMGQLTVLPEHYWKDHDFTESSLDKPLGSGPYEIGEFEVNNFVSYNRVDDYWGKDLPVNVGSNNFGKIRYDYYKDDGAAFEAFKAGKIHLREENSSKTWATQYDFPAVQKGDVQTMEIPTEGPKATQTFMFNLRRGKFADRRVRAAIAQMFDFEWTNKAIFYDQYARPVSYFQGTDDLMATGMPEGAELALLEEHRDNLPAELFEMPFEMPVNDGTGRTGRRILRGAKKLLLDAGWTVKDGVLVDADGTPFELEFMIGSKAQERVVQPFLKNLDRLGIKTNIRMVDAAQYASRIETFNFDMIVNGVSNSASPGNEQREFWGTSAADAPGSRNRAGVANPAIDALIEKIIFAEDREALAAASRALDRVLLWNHYGILELYTPTERVAWWPSKVTKPDETPSHAIGFPSLWWSAEAEG